MNEKELKRLDAETEDDYMYRICGLKEKYGFTWEDIAQILNLELGYNYTESKYRKQYSAYRRGYMDRDKELTSVPDDDAGDAQSILDNIRQSKIELAKEKMVMRDLRTQVNADVRTEARREANRDLAIECAKMIAESPLRQLQLPSYGIIPENMERVGVLCLSDFHYGIEFKNFLNEFSPEICRQRVETLTHKVIEYGEKEGIDTLYVANLGDMIAGLIHLQIRLESRENVVSQTMNIAEILADMLNQLSARFYIHYYSCLDNHSRADANKDNALMMESYALFIPWYLKARLKDNFNIEIHDPIYDEDFIAFEALGHNVIGVHGHKDRPQNIIQDMTCLTKKNYSLAVMGHRHHFSADEQQGVVIVSNGSLMGTDGYAKDLRLTSEPTQNLIILSRDNPCECVYRICVR